MRKDSKKVGDVTGKGFKAGVSGNPKGRPRTRDLQQAVKEFAAEEDPKLRKTRLQRWLEMADRRALQGSHKHLELLLACGYGRPTQTVDLNTTVLTAEQYNEQIEEALAILPADADEQSSNRRVN
jgi:hypothetical protein